MSCPLHLNTALLPCLMYASVCPSTFVKPKLPSFYDSAEQSNQGRYMHRACHSAPVVLCSDVALFTIAAYKLAINIDQWALFIANKIKW